MALAISGIIKFFNRWRLALIFFLLVYGVLLSIDLGNAALYWDEMPHLNAGLLLSRGHIQKYIQSGSYYPPILDVTIALFFKVFGASIFFGRIVSVIFGVLSIWCVFEFAYRFHDCRTALLSSIILASMPGFIRLCRVSLIETTLLFFVSFSLFLFFLLMQTNDTRILFLTGLVLGLSFLVKYNAMITGLTIFVSVIFLWREHIFIRFSKFLFILIIAWVTILPWIILKYEIYVSGVLGRWLYSVQIGSAAASSYSTRFPIPIFYLVEMTYPYSHIHPISVSIYVLALAGLFYWLWRRRHVDKFLLLSFFVVYVVFTLVPDRSWRYITLVFPVLAISASDFILFIWNKTRNRLKIFKTSLRSARAKIDFTKIFNFVFIFFMATSIFYSCRDAYLWVQRDQFHIPIEEASQYVINHSASNEALMVLCPSDHFNLDMFKFYQGLYNSNQISVHQYPNRAIDAFIPIFNVSDLISRCESLNVKYLLLYEYSDLQYFESDLWYHEVLALLWYTGNFGIESVLGERPNQIYIISFASNAN